MAVYDANLGGIDLPTYENDFVEHLEQQFDLVGIQPMPGAPRPPMYDLTLNIYGDPSETDPYTVGATMRTAVRALLQNRVTRFTGIQFTSTFDPDIDGWLVIGSADLAYGDGGPSLADFTLKITGAAVIPAAISMLGFRLLQADKAAAGVPVDVRKLHWRSTPLKGKDVVYRHYLPVGAEDVLAQVQPRLPEMHPYETEAGTGYYVEGRQHGELVTFHLPLAAADKATVQVWDGQTRLYGPSQVPQGLPAVGNGRARATVQANGQVLVERWGKAQGWHQVAQVHTGYPEALTAAVTEVHPDAATVRVGLRGKGTRGDLYVHLQRGWDGPQLDVYHYGPHRTLQADAGAAWLDEGDGWSHARISSQREALAYTGRQRSVAMRRG